MSPYSRSDAGNPARFLGGISQWERGSGSVGTEGKRVIPVAMTTSQPKGCAHLHICFKFYPKRSTNVEKPNVTSILLLEVRTGLIGTGALPGSILGAVGGGTHVSSLSESSDLWTKTSFTA